MNQLAITAAGLLLMLTVMAVAAGIARFNGFYRQELAAGERALTLDGLRGMAALLVVAHHSALFSAQFFTHQWGHAGSLVLQGSGPAAVLIFFMLTGYLFWDKARAARGKINAWKFWRGRFYRIAPLYLFSVLLIIVIMLLVTGGKCFTLENLKPFVRLLALGTLRWSDFGNFNPENIDASVTWTLWFEWRFYLFLPLLVWFATGRRIFPLALLALPLTFAGLWFNRDVELFPVFILGMICPVLLEDRRLRAQLVHPAAAALTLLFGLIIFLTLPNLRPSLAMASGLFPLFLVAAAGNNFFGVLTHPAIRCLGLISYSLYLLHGVMFYVADQSLKLLKLTTLTRLDFCLLMTGTAVLTTLICAFTYRWIEFPFLSAKRNTGRSTAAFVPEPQK